MVMPDERMPGGWLLLLYFLPARQAHARVQAWRRLQRAGAVSLKNSAYVLPHSTESREDLEWIKGEIVASGGQALVVEARALDPATDDDIVTSFRTARRRDFEALTGDAAKLLKRTARRSATRSRRQLTQGVRRLRERFDEAVALDFFGTPEREQAAALLSELDHRLGRTRTMPSPTTHLKTADYREKTWLTRPRPGVDRMSSAWLIRRFIDPQARFVFAEPAAKPTAIPFDTFQAEFGHHGTHCTFETFCERFAISDPSVRRIARIVHDLDLKEATYREPETATVGRLIEGLRRAQPEDDLLLRSGMEMFEALYQSGTAAGATLEKPGKASRRGASPSTARGKSKRKHRD